MDHSRPQLAGCTRTEAALCAPKVRHGPEQCVLGSGEGNRRHSTATPTDDVLMHTAQASCIQKACIFTASSVAWWLQWFQQLLGNFGFKNKFPPMQLRHIFVDERCSADCIKGPSNKAAARIMGNSTGGSMLHLLTTIKKHGIVWSQHINNNCLQLTRNTSAYSNTCILCVWHSILQKGGLSRTTKTYMSGM